MQRTGFFSQPMRRLLLAALVWMGAAVPGVALAQSFACNAAAEGFEIAVPPSGWSIQTSEPSGPQWSDLVVCGEGGNYTNGSGDAACVSSDVFGGAEFDTSLVTPAFSLVGFVTAQVDYTANYQNFASSDFLDVDISADGGTTWTTLLSWNEDHGAHRATPGEDVTVDLAAYAGQANLLLRWRYYDPNSGDYDWYAQIDDVALTCGDGTAPDINVAPLSMAASQAPNTTTSQTLAIGNTGTAALNWTIDEEPAARPAPDASAAGGSTEKLGAPIQTPLSPARLVKLQADTMAANVVQDGSFEAGSPNPFWTEASSVFGSPLCTIADCGTGTGTGPRTGTWWVWFGGAGANVEVGSVTQSVTMPAGGVATLAFWTEQMVCSTAGTADYLEVLVDGTQVWLTTAADPACGVLGYRPITVDLGAFADGGTHTLVFRSVSTGAGSSNFFVDDVTLGAPEPCDSPASVPWLSFTPANGTTAAGGSTNVTVGFDSTGLAAGTYNANLCVTSNDPDAGPGNGTDLVVVPVALTVAAAVPNVNVGVASLAATLAQNATTSQTLAIGNTGTAALTWTMDEEPGSGTCASPASVAWLSFTPASGTTAAAGSDNVTVGFDATGLAAGPYNASLCLSSDDPDAGPGNGTNLVVIPVALTVTAVAAPPPRLVPTFGPVGGTLLGLLLAGFGLVLLRRYQR